MASTSLGYLTQLIPCQKYNGFILDVTSGKFSIPLGDARGEGLVIAPVRMRTHANRDIPARNVDYLEIARRNTSLDEDKLLEPWSPLETTPGGLVLVSPDLVEHILGPRKAKFSKGNPDRISREIFMMDVENDRIEIWNPPDWKRLTY